MLNNFYQEKIVAKNYEQDRLNTNFRRYKHFVETKLLKDALTKEENILEVGCGTGRLSQELLAVGYKLEASDYSSAMLEEFKKKIKEIKPRIADIINLPYSDNSFDAVFSIRVIWHLIEEKDRERAIKELARVSRKKVILDIANKKYIENKFLSFLRKIYFKIFPPSHSLQNKDTAPMDKDGFIKLALEHGLRAEKVFPMDTLPHLWLNILPLNFVKQLFPLIYKLDVIFAKIIPQPRYLIYFIKI